MRLTVLLISVLVFVCVIGCESQSTTPEPPTVTPTPIVQNTATPRATPTLVARLTIVPTTTPTNIPLPIHRTYNVVVKHSCGMSANGVSGITQDGGFALCFEEPGFFEQQSNLDYFVLIVTHTWSEPRLEVFRYHILEGIAPTPTATATATAGPSPTRNPRVTPILGAHSFATPTTVRTIRINVDGYCAAPTNSAALDRVNVCFVVPPGRDGQGNIEYWTITLTRDYTPTAKYGLVEWATPMP